MQTVQSKWLNDDALTLSLPQLSPRSSLWQSPVLHVSKAEMLVRIMSYYRGMKTQKDRAVSTVLCLDFGLF